MPKIKMTQTKELNSTDSILTFHHSKFFQGNFPLQKNLWVKSREKGAKTIINKCF